MFRPIFHLSVIVLYVYTLWYDQNYLDFPLPAEGYSKMFMKGRLMFLTFWCIFLQTFYFMISFLNDIFGTNAPSPKKTPLIRSIKDLVFSFGLPVALYVSVTFWGMCALYKDSIFPDNISKFFPVWFNHTLHTFTSITLLIELLVTNRSYPSRKIGIILTLIFSLSYTVYMHILHARHGGWPYPILGMLSLPQRVVYLVFNTALTIFFYIVAEKLHFAVAKESKPISSGHVKKNK